MAEHRNGDEQTPHSLPIDELIAQSSVGNETDPDLDWLCSDEDVRRFLVGQPTGRPANTEAISGDLYPLGQLTEIDATHQAATSDNARHIFGKNRNHRALDELLALVREPRQGPVVLAGPGGAGKTTAAKTLAEHAKTELGHQVLWISAVDPVTLSQGLTAVARRLGGAVRDVEAIAQGAADAPDRFWRLIENADSGWLLVFDEADDPKVLAPTGDSPPGVQNLTGWVRPSARGLALVTSRESDRRMWGAAQLLTVDPLEETEAAQILRRLAPAAGDDDQARDLARRLRWHPLSLRLAGDYLRSRAARGATFATYEQPLDAKTEADSHAYEPHAAAPTQTPTARTVELSLVGLERQGISQARPVLQLASCYGHTPLPVGLLDAGSLADVLTIPNDAAPSAQGMIEEALRELQEIGLFQPTEDGMAMHTAITEAGRASLDGPNPSLVRIRHAAIELLADRAAELPFDEPDAWPEYLVLGTHLLSLLETTADRVDREHLGQLLETTARVANAFNHMKAGQAVTVLCERALIRGAALGNEHRAVLRVRHQQAWPIADRGRLDDAEALYRDIVQIRLRVLGVDDPDVIDSRHELGWIAACQGDWPAAEEGYREALREGIRILDRTDDESTRIRLTHQIVLTRHELAWVIANRDQNRLDEAHGLFRMVLADRRRLLGDEHPRTLTTRHELAWITARKHRWKGAEAAYRELLDLRLRILGEHHPDTLLTRQELAWIVYRRGRGKEAESRYVDVLDDCRRILGDDHPQTQATHRDLEKARRGEVFDARHVA